MEIPKSEPRQVNNFSLTRNAGDAPNLDSETTRSRPLVHELVASKTMQITHHDKNCLSSAVRNGWSIQTACFQDCVIETDENHETS
jgi:hypothetical protein